MAVPCVVVAAQLAERLQLRRMRVFVERLELQHAFALVDARLRVVLQLCESGTRGRTPAGGHAFALEAQPIDERPRAVRLEAVQQWTGHPLDRACPVVAAARVVEALHVGIDTPADRLGLPLELPVGNELCRERQNLAQVVPCRLRIALGPEHRRQLIARDPAVRDREMGEQLERALGAKQPGAAPALELRGTEQAQQRRHRRFASLGDRFRRMPEIRRAR